MVTQKEQWTLASLIHSRRPSEEDLRECRRPSDLSGCYFILPPRLSKIARFLLTPLAFPWLFPNGWLHVYPERAGIPELEGVVTPPSDLPEISASPTRRQPRSPECFKCFQLITMRSRRTLPDSVGFPTGLHSDRMYLFRQDRLLTRTC